MWLLLLAGLISCTGKPAGAYCPIEMNPPAVVVRFGGPLLAKCTSLSNKTEGMGWESSAGGTGLVLGATSLDLNLKSVTEWDFTPKCFMNADDGDQCSQALPVTIYKTPDDVSMSLLSHTGPMVEGNKYQMSCNIASVAPERNLSVYWHKGKEIIHTETFTESSTTPVNKSSSLDLMVHRDDDGTGIWCEAKLNLNGGPDLLSFPSKSQVLTVQYAPVFTEPANETVEVAPDSKLILSCTATGNPSPSYSWKCPQLTFTNSQPENQPVLHRSFHVPGTYSCIAYNVIGSKTKYFTVTEASGNRTTFASIVGVGVVLGVVLFIAGVWFVTPNGTFSVNPGYLRAASGPV